MHASRSESSKIRCQWLAPPLFRCLLAHGGPLARDRSHHGGPRRSNRILTYAPNAKPGDFWGGTATYTRPFDPPHSDSPRMTFAVGGKKLKSSALLNMISTDPPSSRLDIMGVVTSSVDGRWFRTELQRKNPAGLVYGSYGPTSTLSRANFSKGILNVTWAHAWRGAYATPIGGRVVRLAMIGWGRDAVSPRLVSLDNQKCP